MEDRINKIAKELGYDYLYHFNEYTEKWNVFTRENYMKYFNGKIDKDDVGIGIDIDNAVKDLISK